MIVIQRVYLRAEKGMPVIHQWYAATTNASREILVLFFLISGLGRFGVLTAWSTGVVGGHRQHLNSDNYLRVIGRIFRSVL